VSQSRTTAKETDDVRQSFIAPMPLVSKWLSLSASALSFLAATAVAEPRRPTHVACVGDSITQGSGATSPSKNYVSQLQVLLGNQVDVQNFGRSGTTMLSAGFGDRPYVLDSQYTDATSFVSTAPEGAVVSVVIILGANDSKPQNWDPTNKPKNDQQYLKDYRAMVDHFLGLPSKPVVYAAFPLATGNNPCCSIRGGVIRDQQIPLIKQVAMEKHLPIIDLNTPTSGHPEYFGDGVHPNDAGYLVMAKLVKAGLEREPTVSIVSPTVNAMPGAGTLALTAMASGDTVDIASVEFFEGLTSLGKATTAPFMLTWQATAGSHTITARATDTTLANNTSQAVTFIVKDAAGGGAGGVASGGAGAGGEGGVAHGAAGAGGAATGGTLGGLPSAGAPAAGGPPEGAGSATTIPRRADDALVDNGGCNFSPPGSRGPAGTAWLLVALVSLAVRRRRAA
jgi:MYXO-CTERM domain-containing protein